MTVELSLCRVLACGQPRCTPSHPSWSSELPGVISECRAKSAPPEHCLLAVSQKQTGEEWNSRDCVGKYCVADTCLVLLWGHTWLAQALLLRSWWDLAPGVVIFKS